MILIGTLFDFLFLIILGWAGGLVWVFIGYIGLDNQLKYRTRSSAGAALPDLIPPEKIVRPAG